MATAFPLNRDLVRLLFNRSEYPELVGFCSQFPDLDYICRNPDYWRARLKRDFNLKAIIDVDPEDLYRSAYYNLGPDCMIHSAKRNPKICAYEAGYSGDARLIDSFIGAYIRPGYVIGETISSAIIDGLRDSGYLYDQRLIHYLIGRGLRIPINRLPEPLHGEYYY